MTTEQELMQDKYDLIINKFEELMIENSEVSLIDNLKKVLNEFNFEINTKFIFYLLERILRSWIDMNNDYYPVIASWIIGTYFFDNWQTYPYIFINAMKRSGKTRLLKLIAFLCKDGRYTMSLTESVLFRLPAEKKCGLFIDEIENIGSKDKSALRELLNVAYKRGGVVYRSRKNSSTDRYQIDGFELFIPIAMANIRGLEDVLSDRCITLILERSYNTKIVNRLEWFEKDFDITLFKYLINQNIILKIVTEDMPKTMYMYFLTLSSLSSLSSSFNKISTEDNLETEDIIFSTLLKKAEYNGVIGRDLELWLPLFITKAILTSKVEDLIDISGKFVKERQLTDMMEDLDNGMIIFLARFLIAKQKGEYISYKEISSAYSQETNYKMNPRTLARILKRLNVIIDKRHVEKGNEATFDIEKINAKVKSMGIEIEPLQSKDIQTTIIDQDNSYIDENDQSLGEDSNAI